ncbi:MAG: ribosome maturation factor RimP [Peptococcaceae bacterium]|nr:ribosome maturation factor RimP [Peptococcaceae bacterium]
MVKRNVVNIVESLARPVVEASGKELVDVEFVKEGGRWYLRIYIDKPGGVGLDDCQEISEKIDRLLDETDPVQHSYTLEVSSPGIERPLKKPADYQRFAGRLATVTTFGPVDGRRKITGVLKGLCGEAIVLAAEDGRECLIPLEKVASARLAAEF